MHRAIFSLVFAAVVALASSQAKPAYEVETLARGLNYPWAIQFLPNGDMLITEKLGALRIVRGGKLDATAVAGGPKAYQETDCGILDVALDPDFAKTKRVFISFSEGNAQANHMAIYRARFDGKALHDGRVIFHTTPDKAKGSHCGSRIVFLPDKTFIVTIGDGYDYRNEAQNLASHLGKTLRLNRDGKVPADNPFVGKANARPEIYTYGHRNPQGLLRDPRNGDVWLHEHGPKGGDEVNLLKRGANYGWPKTTYGIDYSGAIISDLKEAPGVESPIVVWVPSIAPSGFALYLGEKFPAWRGDFFVGALAEKSLRRVRISNGKPVAQEVLLRELDARIRDVREGPDGYLYLLTDEENGRLLRLRPEGDCASTCELP